MADRDKLIELLISCDKENDVLECFSERPKKNQAAEIIADYLLENNVIMPPCRVGDTVFVLTSDSVTGFEKSRVKRMLLKNLQDGMTIKIIVPCVCDDWGGAVREFYSEDFGKTIFLTLEEVKKALKK